VAGAQCAACTADPDITLYSSDGKRTPRAPVPSEAADPALGAVRGQLSRLPHCVAWCLPPLAPRLAPRILVSLANGRGQHRIPPPAEKLKSSGHD
jgi:hypothetical protein